MRAIVSILTRPEGRMLRAERSKLRSSSPFQSSPGPKAGCYPGHQIIWPVRVCEFQSSPGPKAGCYTTPGGHTADSPGFNPHPARRPDATAVWHRSARPGAVSILTRPEGRMLPVVKDVGSLVDGFQSSPGPKAGCYLEPEHNDERHIWVSILTRPEGRMLQIEQGLTSLSTLVSILTRPEGRMLLKAIEAKRYDSKFQSSPGPKAGCYRALRSEPSTACCFNPHPARRPDATESGLQELPITGVSILTRPEGRMLP